MLHSLKGIVLHHINYSDTSIIAKIYTNELGLQSYIVNGVRKKKARIHLNTFQAFNLLDLEVVHKPKANLHRIKEVKITFPLTSLSTNFLKRFVVLFLNEMIYKSIKEEEPNEQLFLFLKSAILFLETTTENIANFHIAFLLEFSKHLGFYPDTEVGFYFNLEEGIFQNHPSNKTLDKTESNLWYQFLTSPWMQNNNIQITGKQRKTLLYRIIDFYKIHIESFGNIKSLDVLQTVLS